jgi:hypothetical protein
MNGTAVFGERVVIVEVHGGRVNLKKGRISSTAASHVFADNQVETVVSGDRPFRPVTDSPEEAHERSFRVDDIHLLRQQEAHLLQDPDAVQAWFGSVYQDPLVTKIRRALKRLQMD